MRHSSPVKDPKGSLASRMIEIIHTSTPLGEVILGLHCFNKASENLSTIEGKTELIPLVKPLGLENIG
jgi:hypothetical protein